MRPALLSLSVAKPVETADLARDAICGFANHRLPPPLKVIETYATLLVRVSHPSGAVLCNGAYVESLVHVRRIETDGNGSVEASSDGKMHLGAGRLVFSWRSSVE